VTSVGDELGDTVRLLLRLPLEVRDGVVGPWTGRLGRSGKLLHGVSGSCRPWRTRLGWSREHGSRGAEFAGEGLVGERPVALLGHVGGRSRVQRTSAPLPRFDAEASPSPAYPFDGFSPAPAAQNSPLGGPRCRWSAAAGARGAQCVRGGHGWKITPDIRPDDKAVFFERRPGRRQSHDPRDGGPSVRRSHVHGTEVTPVLGAVHGRPSVPGRDAGRMPHMPPAPDPPGVCSGSLAFMASSSTGPVAPGARRRPLPEPPSSLARPDVRRPS
jgi:hypothetical protein